MPLTILYERNVALWVVDLLVVATLMAVAGVGGGVFFLTICCRQVWVVLEIREGSVHKFLILFHFKMCYRLLEETSKTSIS